MATLAERYGSSASNYHGYPFRTKIHGTRLEGFSDHFPVYTVVGLSLSLE
ncbi:MAG: hypothetical protein ABF277_08430 [Candidatus Arcticimaribacter sp.]